MKIQKNISFLCIKKCLNWFLIMIGISFAYIVIIRLIKSIEYSEISSLLGIPGVKNINFYNSLTIIYQYSFTIYYSYLFYNYEKQESMDNIILRMNPQNWIKSKIIVQLIAIFILRFIYTLIIILILQINLKKYLFIIVSSFAIHIFLSIFVIFLSNYYRKSIKFIILITSICLIESMIYNHIISIIVNVLFGILIILYEYFTFNFKVKFIIKKNKKK